MKCVTKMIVISFRDLKFVFMTYLSVKKLPIFQ